MFIGQKKGHHRPTEEIESKGKVGVGTKGPALLEEKSVGVKPIRNTALTGGKITRGR